MMHRWVLAVAWDDQEHRGLVYAVRHDGPETTTLIDRSCDAYCVRLHARKGAERLLEDVLGEAPAGFVDELFGD